jgi:hypothetical protein
VCSNEEEFSSYSCSFGNCCVAKAPKSAPWIIIILIILIVLVLIGILFRKKLRQLLLKFKFGKGKSKAMQSAGGPRFPPTSSQRIFPGPIQRRIIRPVQHFPQRRPVPKDKGDYDEVLKKLKEISK